MKAYLAHDITRTTRWISADNFESNIRPGDLLVAPDFREVINVEEVAKDGEIFVSRGRLGTYPRGWAEATEFEIVRKPSQELW